MMNTKYSNKNVWTPLDRVERKRVNELNDPLFELIMVNGWRRSELSQALLNWSDENAHYAYFKPKKQQSVKPHLLTNKERNLLNELKSTLFAKTKATLGAYNKVINRYFSKIRISLGLEEFFPHRLRATFGTEGSRLGVPLTTMSTAMNHKNVATTIKYIQPDQEDVFEVKDLMGELVTKDGMTIPEWRAFALSKVRQNNRLEKALEAAYDKIKFLQEEAGKHEQENILQSLWGPYEQNTQEEHRVIKALPAS